MISRILFESLWLLATVMVAIQFGLISIWSWRRGRAWGRTVWIGFAAIPLLMLVSTLVITSREQIVQLCHDLAGYVETGDLTSIAGQLADDFEANGFDADGIIERLSSIITHHRIEQTTLSRFDVTFPAANVGLAEFHASARVRSPQLLYQWLTSHWRLSFRRDAGLWKVTRIESVPTGPLNFGNITDWLR